MHVTNGKTMTRQYVQIAIATLKLTEDCYKGGEEEQNEWCSHRHTDLERRNDILVDISCNVKESWSGILLPWFTKMLCVQKTPCKKTNKQKKNVQAYSPSGFMEDCIYHMSKIACLVHFATWSVSTEKQPPNYRMLIMQTQYHPRHHLLQPESHFGNNDYPP